MKNKFHKTKLFLTLLSLSFILVSCMSSKESEGYSFILNRLKSPSSATLVSSNYSDKIKRTVEEHCSVKLPSCITVGYFEVDAQNGYGAKIRNNYFVFYKNGVPCHLETNTSLDTDAHSGYSSSLNAVLQYNGCSCE